jgi:ribosome modulation factor
VLHRHHHRRASQKIFPIHCRNFVDRRDFFLGGWRSGKRHDNV